MAYNYTTGDGERIFSPLYADVWETTLKHLNGSAVKVYIALLMHTTQQDRTWYMSVDEIAADAGVSRGAAFDGKDKLIEVGLVEQSWRYRDEAGDYHLTDTRPPPRMQGKNVYRVSVKPRTAGSENQNHEGVHRVQKSDSIGSENQTLVGSENQTQNITPTPEPPTEPPTEPLSPQGGSSGDERDDFSGDFKEFWEAYPRKKGTKKDVEKIFNRVAEDAGPEALILGAKNFAAECKKNNTQDRYICYPSTFLNQGRWKEYQGISRGRDWSSFELSFSDFEGGDSNERPF